MKRLELAAIGAFEPALLERLARDLADTFHLPCAVLGASLDPAFAFHPERQQFHASEILHAMQPLAHPRCWRLLGVSMVDLYIPVLTFVFGEAQMGGPCGVVSGYRLRQEFYGLPHDPRLLYDRLRKEAVHELGHTVDLTHCDDYTCAMAASHAVEWIDLKNSTLCDVCQSRIMASTRG
jgi:archaemetzincin